MCTAEIQNDDDIAAPEDNAWLPSKLVYSWAGPVFRKASIADKAGEGLNHDNLLPLTDEDTASSIRTKFNLALMKWRAEAGNSKKQRPGTKLKYCRDRSPRCP